MTEPQFGKLIADSKLERPSKKIAIEGNSEFPEITIFSRKERPDEKMVRIYRGVTKNDPSVANQPPYALRTVDADGKLTLMEDARAEVDNLAANPSYGTLVEYLEKTDTHRTDEERVRLESELYTIEERILKGWSVRDCLMTSQIGHGAGFADSGLSPYTSATLNPNEAAQYSREAVLVYEIPISKIQTHNQRAPEGEVHIKGGLDHGDLVAIITHNLPAGDVTRNDEAELNKALSTLDEALPPDLSNDDFNQAMTQQFGQEKDFDEQQKRSDLEDVRIRRILRFTETFPEVRLNLENLGRSAKSSSTDIYTEAKYKVFDHYAKIYKGLIGDDADVCDEEFTDSRGNKESFSRENITDEMLVKLKKLIRHLQNKLIK